MWKDLEHNFTVWRKVFKMKLICLILLFFSCLPLGSCECPKGFYEIDGADSSKCYSVLGVQTNQIDAHFWCKALGSTLIMPTKLGEIHAITDYVKKHYGTNRMNTWLGYKRVTSNKALFHNPHTKEAMPDIWKTGQPDNSGNKENCAMVGKKYDMSANDWDCWNNARPVCEAMKI